MITKYDELYNQVAKLLGSNSKLLDALLIESKKRPKTKKSFATKRDRQAFKIAIRGQGSQEITGWENLSKATGLKIATLRVYFSKNNNCFSYKKEFENGTDIYTIKKL